MQKLDLTGQRVLVGRVRPGPSGIASRLRAYGVEVIEAPEVRVEEMADGVEYDKALLDLNRYHSIIFACAASVDAVIPKLQKFNGSVPIIAIGEQAGAALRRLGVAPTIITHGACYPELKIHLSQLADTRNLIFSSIDGRPQLKRDLSALGIEIHSVVVYRHVYQFPAQIPGRLDAVIIPGSSVATLLLKSEWGSVLRNTPVVAMGSRSAGAARRCGAEYVIQAEHDTVDAIVDCTVKHLAKNMIHADAVETLEELVWKR